LPPKQLSADKKKSNVSICIASPFGGSYRTTLSVYLSNVLSLSRRTLLISMDPFFTPIRYGLPYSDGALTKCIASLVARVYEFTGKSGVYDFAERIGAYITNNGSFEGLYGCDHWADVTELTQENALRLIESAKCEYEAIVVDVSDLYRAGSGFIESCDFVFTPMQGNADAHGKLQEWKRQLAMMGIDADSTLQMLNVPFDEDVESGQCLIADMENGVLGEYAKFLAERCAKDE
jgi:cellulose biosynthesis protein BcsQ